MKRKINIIGLTLFFTLTLFSLAFSEESMTITTYYPSPYGSYNELYVAGYVGIGTTGPSWSEKVSMVQGTAGNPGLAVRMPTGAETTAPGIRVYGYSPAIELMDKDSVQNWYIGIDDNDANKFLIGRGYGPGQGVAQAMTIDALDNVGIGTAASPGTYKLYVNGPLAVNSSTADKTGASTWG